MISRKTNSKIFAIFFFSNTINLSSEFPFPHETLTLTTKPLLALQRACSRFFSFYSFYSFLYLKKKNSELMWNDNAYKMFLSVLVNTTCPYLIYFYSKILKCAMWSTWKNQDKDLKNSEIIDVSILCCTSAHWLARWT